MKDIKTYSIGRLQKGFDLVTQNTNYFYTQTDDGPLYFDEPFRTETYAIIFLKEGILPMYTDLVYHEVKAPAVITLAPDVTRSFQRRDRDANLLLLFFKDTFLLETRADILYLNRFFFFEDNDAHALSLLEDERSRLCMIFNMIASTFNKGHLREQFLMRSYIYLLIHEIDAMQLQRKITREPRENRSTIFVKFRNLLTREFLRHRSVSFYASNLQVSPKYLSEVIKKETGKTPSEWIDRSVMLEAKVLLQNRSLNVAQVSERLNFSDQSVFGKFFKAHSGISPMDYRKKQI